MPDPSRTIHAGRRLGDRYVLRRLIDKGGMAEVWEAEDSVLGRAVAVPLATICLKAKSSATAQSTATAFIGMPPCSPSG